MSRAYRNSNASPAARLMIHSSGFQTDLESLRAAPLIEYRALMALKRKVLEELLHTLDEPVCQAESGFRTFH